MEWKMETILQLIDLYRQYPCLWNSDVDGYKCKKSRNVAWTEISDKLAIERVEIERKMRNLMSQFSRECKRYRRAKIDGKIYRSKWYGFKRLLFLRCKNKEHICRTDDEIQNKLLNKSIRKSQNYYFNGGMKIENYEEQLFSINNHFQDFISFKENSVQENEPPNDFGQQEMIVNNNVSPETSVHEAEFQQEQSQQQQQSPQQQLQQHQQQQLQQQEQQPQQQERQEVQQLQKQHQQQKHHRHQCQHHQHHRHHHHRHHHQRQRSSGSNQFQDQDSSNQDNEEEEEDVKPKKEELRKKLKLKCSLLKQMNKTKMMPSTSSSSSSNRKTIRRGGDDNKRIKVKDVYGVAYKALTDNVNKDIDRFEHVGKNFALKMKEMNHKQQVIAEKIISDVIFYGEIEYLNVATAQKISNVLASSRKD